MRRVTVINETTKRRVVSRRTVLCTSRACSREMIQTHGIIQLVICSARQQSDSL
jgi:hypothetical protein